MNSKEELQSLIAEGKVQKALNNLLEITKKKNLKELHDEVLMISAKYKSYEKEKRLGTSKNETQNISLAKINEALLQIINQIPGKEGKQYQKLANRKSSRNEMKRIWKFVLGISVIIGFFTGVFEIFDLQKAITLKKNRNSESVTIFVHGKQSNNELILKNKGKVEITYGGARVLQGINENGQAIFNEIPSYFFSNNAKVYINIRDTDGEPFRALFPDSLYQLRSGEPIFLQVILDNLDKIFGSVYWDEKPLPKVIVSVGQIRDTTNEFGEYELQIPEKLQKQQQLVKFFKTGFKLQTKIAHPQTDKALDIIMTKD